MNVKKLLIPIGIMSLFLLSWSFSPTRLYWDLLDRCTFYVLNSWVRKSAFWQNIWAFMGTRIMDGINDSLMLLFLIYLVKKAAQINRKRKIAELIFTCLLIVSTLYIVNRNLIYKYAHFYRESPTLVCENSFYLSHVIKWTAVKDQSNKSFPGDHATTNLLFASIIYHLAGWRFGTLAAIYGVIFCFPRLVVGAHWITDVLFGSLTIALSVSSLMFGTPIANHCINLIGKCLWWKEMKEGRDRKGEGATKSKKKPYRLEN